MTPAGTGILRTISVISILLLIVSIFSPVLTPVTLAAAGSLPPLPETDESPRSLILGSIAQLDSVSIDSGPDKPIIEQARSCLRNSSERDFWDDCHARSAQVFASDLIAVQLLKTTGIYANATSPSRPALLSAITGVLQSDRELASGSIADASAAVRRISNPLTLRLMNASIGLARKDYAKAERYLQQGSDGVAIGFYSKAWLEANVAVKLADQKVSPGVTIVSPAGGFYSKEPSITVSGKVDDIAVYSIGDVSVKVNGNASRAPLANGSYSLQVALASGLNNISVTAEDAFGNRGIAAVSVVLDTVKPAIAIAEVEDGAYYNSSVLPVVTFADANIGYTSVTVDGVPYTGAPINDEGLHVLDASALDLAGNNASARVSFVIDQTAPVVALAGLTAGYAGMTASIDGRATDANLDSLSLRIDGREVSRQLPYLWDTLQYPDGNHTIELCATDKAGNSGYASLDVISDNTPPSVRFALPENGSFSQLVDVELRWGGSDNFGLSFYQLLFDGTPAGNTTATDRTVEGLADGPHQALVRAYDLANNTATDSVIFTVDTTLPAIAIYGVEDGGYYNRIVVPDVLITEANPDTSVITLDGTIYGGAPVSEEGAHQLRVYAADLAGHTATRAINFTIDKSPPAVRITDPENGSEVGGTVSVAGTVADLNPDTVRLYVDGEEIGSALPCAWNTSACRDGAHELALFASDRAGNEAWANVTVTVSNSRPPALAVYEMTRNPTLRSPEYCLAGLADPAAVLRVNGIAVQHNGNFSFRTNVTEGFNLFNVSAASPSGTVAWRNWTRLVDTDSLPDFFELNATGTDPLAGDTDGDGVPDDLEDPDDDGLTNVQEYYLGTKPQSADSDEDGLTDAFEVARAGTSPLLSDSYGDNVRDSDRDSDSDGLTSLEEQTQNTDPRQVDTDGDGLADGHEVNVSHTLPLDPDSDGDGLEDGAEARLGSDPAIPDGDGDGIPDGKEFYVQSFTNETAGLGAIICAEGDAGRNLTLGNEENPAVLLGNLSGVYRVARVSLSQNVSWATVRMSYDPAQVPDPARLRMFLYNTTTDRIEPVEVQGINTQEHYYWGNVSHFSDPFVADASGWFDRWYVDWQYHTLMGVSLPGSSMWLTARVHNRGEGTATDVRVEFRENDASGTVIGQDTISSIAPGATAEARVMWTVKAGVRQIAVVVDPAGQIAEAEEGNNAAARDVTGKIDSDMDWLNDYEEEHGMRVAFPYQPPKSNPYSNDSDNDTLTDDLEMGIVNYDPDNKKLYDSLADTYGWDKALYDGWHYEYFSDPSDPDTDDDGLTDRQEYDAGLDRFHRDGPFIVEALAGYILGDAGMDDPAHANLAYLGGSIASSITPVIEYLAMLRDIGADSWNGHWDMAGMNLASLALGTLFIEDVTPIEELPAVGSKVARFVTSYQHMAGKVGQYLVKAMPVDATKLLLRDYVYQALPAAIKAGLGEDGMYALSRLGVNLNNFKDCVVTTWYSTVHGPAIVLEKYGVHVNVLYVADKAVYLDDVAWTVGAKEYEIAIESTMELRGVDRATARSILADDGITLDSIRQVIRNDLRNTANGYFGEHATYYHLLNRGDLRPLGFSDGFLKYDPSQHGYDFLCWDDAAKQYVIVEAKGTTSGGDVGKDILRGEMTPKWIEDSITRMHDEHLISDELMAKLMAEINARNIGKEVYVIQDAARNENLVKSDLASLNLDSVYIVKVGEAA